MPALNLYVIRNVLLGPAPATARLPKSHFGNIERTFQLSKASDTKSNDLPCRKSILIFDRVVEAPTPTGRFSYQNCSSPYFGIVTAREPSGSCGATSLRKGRLWNPPAPAEPPPLGKGGFGSLCPRDDTLEMSRKVQSENAQKDGCVDVERF